MSLLLGRNPGPIQRGKSIDELTVLTVPAGLPSDLLEQRPDIRQAEQDLIAANARIGVAKALYFPDISLTGVFGVSSTKLTDLFTGPARKWTWSVPLTEPVFTAGAIAGQVKQAEAFEQETLLQYQKTIQNAFRDVEDSFVDQSLTQGGFRNRNPDKGAAFFSRVTRLRYKNGYTDYITVLDAEHSLFNTELITPRRKNHFPGVNRPV